MQTYWKAVDGIEVLRKSWDGETAIYNIGSGDTQLLDSVGITVLDLIQTRSINDGEILRHIKGELGIQLDNNTLLDLLDELSRSGIISRFQA